MKPRFTFKPFQREDYARAALHPGAVLAHDTGGGKTIGELTLPLLWCGFTVLPSGGLRPNAPVLIVAPEDGHEQTADEARERFKAQLIPLPTQAEFLRRTHLDSQRGTRELPPGYYLVSYTQLTSNGVQDFPSKAQCLNAPLDAAHPLSLTPEDVARFFEGCAARFYRDYEVLGASADFSLAQLTAAWQRLRKATKIEVVQNLLDAAYERVRMVAAAGIEHLTPEQLDWCRRETVAAAWVTYQQGIGESRTYETRSGGAFTVKCTYSPSLADLSSATFACVCVDEGVRMKGEDTDIGKGIRQMQPPYRLVLTATPIKNRLPDAFSLLHWVAAAGAEGNARFPYGDTPEHRGDFEREFLTSERNLTKEEQTDRRCVKLTPQVMNIHRLWKLFGPLVLRRRKPDFGEAIVAKHRHVIRVPMGKHQRAAYKFHLDAKYLDVNQMPAIGAKLQALRIVAANPSSGLLHRPASDPDIKGTPRSNYDYIPKLASALNLIRELLTQGEQVVVFSAFNDASDALSERLREAGVAHRTCDGRMNPKKRGAAAKEFKQKKFPVLLAGVESMGELHNFSQCSNVILMSYSWAYDKFEQAINRVHRLNSPKDVHVWSILCDGSIDGRLEGNIHEKGDSADLVLDGKLLGETPSEVNLWELLRDAEKEFQKSGALDEAKLEQEWPQVRTELAAAAAKWRPGPLVSPPPVAVPQPRVLPARPPSAFDDLPLWVQAA